MKEWSLISCQVFSNLIRYYRRKFRAVKLANRRFQKVFNKRVLLIAGNVYQRFFFIYILWDISPHFKLFVFNERLDFLK